MKPEDWVELIKRNSSQIIPDEMESMSPETGNRGDDPTRPILRTVFHVKHFGEMDKMDEMDETGDSRETLPGKAGNLNLVTKRNLLFYLLDKAFIAFQIMLWVPVMIAVIAALSIWLFGGALLILRELGFEALVTSIPEYFPLTLPWISPVTQENSHLSQSPVLYK